MLSVVSTIDGLKKTSGGPCYSVTKLCESLVCHGVKQCLVTVSAGKTEDARLPEAALVPTLMVPGKRIERLRISVCPEFSSALAKCCRKHEAQIIHTHGLWSWTVHQAAAVARSLNIPWVISPRGMLSPWAMKHKAWKKRLAWLLYQNRDLLSAVLFHVTSEQEAKEVRHLGFAQPIAVIPNGMDLPELDGSLKRGKLPNRAESKRTVLFLGRIHPVKGLRNLVDAWALLRPSGWRCVIVGPDECGHQAELDAAIDAAKLKADFMFQGEVDGTSKWDLYRTADLFVLPSYTENFGNVVTEALAAGVPVITTTGTPWRELETHDCGWWIDIGAEPLSRALQEAMALTDCERQEMGKRGRSLIGDRYSWDKVARDMLAVYEWVCGHRDQPDCLY